MLQQLLTLFVEFAAAIVKAVIICMTAGIADTIYMEWTAPAPSMGVWWILFFAAAWVILCLLWGFARFQRCWVPALSVIPLCAAGAGQQALQVHDWLMIAVLCCQFWALVHDLIRQDSPFVKAVEGCTGGNCQADAGGFPGKQLG